MATSELTGGGEGGPKAGKSKLAPIKIIVLLEFLDVDKRDRNSVKK